jgi:hypothetical protein
MSYLPQMVSVGEGFPAGAGITLSLTDGHQCK